MLVWLTLPFHDFCGFRSVAVNSVYKLQFFYILYSNYVPILHRFCDIARYCSKIADLNLPHICLAFPLGVIPLKFRRDCGHQKTSPWAIVCRCFVILGLAILVQLRRDRQTNRRRTDCTDTRRRQKTSLA